jgi:hypothetical protein
VIIWKVTNKNIPEQNLQTRPTKPKAKRTKGFVFGLCSLLLTSGVLGLLKVYPLLQNELNLSELNLYW